MSDKTALGISEELRQFIEALVENVLLEGGNFDNQKKYLVRFCQTENVDFSSLETNLVALFETAEELKAQESKGNERLFQLLAKECYISLDIINKIISDICTKRRAEEETRRKRKAEERAKAEHKVQEEAKKALEEAERERKAREEERKKKELEERKACIEAEIRAKEARIKVLEEKVRLKEEQEAREERDRKAREERGCKAREEAERKIKGSSEISKFFPVYGVILGKTKVYDLPPLIFKGNLGADRSYLISDNSRTTLISDCQGNVEHIIVHKGDDLPFKWTSLGFDWGLSYNQCMSLVQKLGFSVKEVQKPTCENPYGNVHYFRAAFEATSPSGIMSINIGIDVDHEASADSPNLLDYISFRYLG